MEQVFLSDILDACVENDMDRESSWYDYERELGIVEEE